VVPILDRAWFRLRARQTESFDPDGIEDEDPEMVDLERKLEISRSASELLVVERAREWLLGEGD
jgi:hypothetical protein